MENTNMKEREMKGRSFKAQILEQSASKSSERHDPSKQMAPKAEVEELGRGSSYALSSSSSSSSWSSSQ